MCRTVACVPRRRDVDRALTEIRLLRVELQDALARLGALERSLAAEAVTTSSAVNEPRGEDDSLIMDARWIDEMGRTDDDWVDYTPLAGGEHDE